MKMRGKNEKCIKKIVWERSVERQCAARVIKVIKCDNKTCIERYA